MQFGRVLPAARAGAQAPRYRHRRRQAEVGPRDSPQSAAALLGAARQISVARGSDEVIRCAKRERLDRQRRMIAPARDEIAAVDDEQIRHVVRTMELVDDRSVGIVALIPVHPVYMWLFSLCGRIYGYKSIHSLQFFHYFYFGCSTVAVNTTLQEQQHVKFEGSDNLRNSNMRVVGMTKYFPITS